MVFYILQKAILHVLIITNSPVWKVEQRRQDRFYCPISETESMKLRLVVVNSETFSEHQLCANHLQ